MYGDIASLLFFRFWRNRWSDLFIETPEGPQSWDCIDGDSGALFLSSISLLAASIIALACNMWINLLIAYNQATALMIGLLSISSSVEVVNVKLKLKGYGHDSLNFPMQCSTLFGCWATTLEEDFVCKGKKLSLFNPFPKSRHGNGPWRHPLSKHYLGRKGKGKRDPETVIHT